MFPAQSFVLIMHRKSYCTDFIFTLIGAQQYRKDTAIKVHLKFWNEHVSASVSRVSGARGNSWRFIDIE